jgi:hypothetical protein
VLRSGEESMKRKIASWICVLALALATGPIVAEDEGEGGEPAKVRVQHVLIGFKHSIPNKKIDRTKKEAEKLAQDVLETALAGVEFPLLVQKYSDDRYPGIYTLANKGETPLPGEYRRYDMQTCFGDVAFSLEIDEIGLAEYRGGRCEYGWHVIKRLE